MEDLKPERRRLPISCDLRNFRDWLRSKPKGWVVGTTHSDCSCCPLEQFLSGQTNPFHHICTDYSGWRYYGQRELSPLPFWAYVFMSRVDSMPPNRKITKEQGLKFLQQCEEWVEWEKSWGIDKPY